MLTQNIEILFQEVKFINPPMVRLSAELQYLLRT